jgi:hypothetical protein
MTMEGRALWIRQIRAMFRLELRRTLWSRRAFMMYALAALPVVPLIMFNIAVLIIGDLPEEMKTESPLMIYANMFTFLVRAPLYLAIALLFSSLIRGEILDRSLHYYFLAPIRREVFVVGKFVSGWIASTIIFSISTISSFLLLHLAFGGRHLVDYVGGIGSAHLLGYLVVVALACLGYGAVFLAVGLLLKNPLVPAAIIWLWEQANPFMPAAAKKFSIVHYLNSLMPVTPTDGPVALLVEPTPWWMALTGFLILSTLILAFSGWRIRSQEIHYGAE